MSELSKFNTSLNRRNFIKTGAVAGIHIMGIGCSNVDRIFAENAALPPNAKRHKIQPVQLDDGIELVFDAGAELGEGPFWDSRRQVLYWVDILGEKLHAYHPASLTDIEYHIGQPVGTVVPRNSGDVMLAIKDGFASLDLQSGTISILKSPEQHLPRNRFNDGKCDPAGRFWAGTISLDGEPNVGNLYRLDVDNSVHHMLDDITISNGINWTADRKKMYFIDSATHKIDVFDYDIDSGDIRNRRVAVQIPEELGFPDGMTIDEEGMLWVGMAMGYTVTRWNPNTGELLATYRFPAKFVSACAFGGPDLRDLYVTSGRTGQDEETLAKTPHAGGLFLIRPGARGVELPGYDG